MKNRINRVIAIHYTPIEWGIKIVGEEITVWARLVRTDPESDYSFYGDDADCYREFDKEGFTISAKVNDYKEADRWIKKNVLAEDGVNYED